MIKDDTGHSLKTKMDLGVHKNIQIEQDEFCFDVCHDEEGVSLLINSTFTQAKEDGVTILEIGEDV